MVWVGFNQDDWIFFDKVAFNADGQLFTWDIDYENKHTQVMWGGIAEWTGQEDVEPTTKARFLNDGIDTTLFNAELVDQMTLLANAKIAKIRFSGQGYRDHIVTDQEKANLKTFIELYGQYEDLGSD